MISLTFTLDYPGLTPADEKRIGAIMERRLKEQISQITSTLTMRGEEATTGESKTPFMSPVQLDVNSIVIVS